MDLSVEKKDGSWEPPLCIILQSFCVSAYPSLLQNLCSQETAPHRREHRAEAPRPNEVCSCDRRDNDLFLLVLIAHNIQNKNVEVRQIWICYQRSHILSAIIISEDSSLLSNSIRNQQTRPNLSIIGHIRQFYLNVINLYERAYMDNRLFCAVNSTRK